VAVRTYVHCVLCGYDVKPARLGLREDGVYDATTAPAHVPELRVDHIGGRGKLAVEKLALPMPFALGVREALRAALARVEAEILEAGGELPD